MHYLYLLEAAGHIDPDFRNFLDCLNYTEHSTVERETGLGGDYLDEGCYLTVLVTLHSAVGIGGQVILQQAEALHRQALGIRTECQQKQQNGDNMPFHLFIN